MHRITLTDLDGVHFRSLKGSPSGSVLRPVAISEQGVANGFMTAQQEMLLSWLFAGSEVIPVTARNVESFRRISIPFRSYSICSFGGVVLDPEGSSDPAWQSEIRGQSKSCAAIFAGLKEGIGLEARSTELSVVATPIADDGALLYLNCKLAVETEPGLIHLNEYAQRVLPSGWHLHSNGNNVAFLPPFLSKLKAASYYLSEFAPPERFVLGLGDSITDLDFMAICDCVAMPTDSQVFALLKRLGHKSKGEE